MQYIYTFVDESMPRTIGLKNLMLEVIYRLDDVGRFSVPI